MALALKDAGLEARSIRRAIHSACGLKKIDHAEEQALRTLFGGAVRCLAPAALYGNVEGASGAMQLVGSLLEEPAATLPALVLTCDPAGTAAALVATS